MCQGKSSLNRSIITQYLEKPPGCVSSLGLLFIKKFFSKFLVPQPVAMDYTVTLAKQKQLEFVLQAQG